MPVQLSPEEIKHLATLAKLELGKAEETLYSTQLEEILKYFEKIDAAPIENVEPMYHALPLLNVMRIDEPRKYSEERILELAPQRKGRFIKAPKMM